MDCQLSIKNSTLANSSCTCNNSFDNQMMEEYKMTLQVWKVKGGGGDVFF